MKMKTPSEGMTTLYLVRHAESAPSPLIAECDWPLSPNGHKQAEHLADYFEQNRIEVHKLYSGPYKRAIDTLFPLAQRKGLSIELNEAFRERKLTETMVDNFLEILEQSWNDFDFSMPNCESGNQCLDRFYRGIIHVARENLGKSVIVSSHGNAIGIFLNFLDSTFQFQSWRTMKNPDLFKITFEDDLFAWSKEDFQLHPNPI